jgi:uncharacterized membrane protein
MEKPGGSKWNDEYMEKLISLLLRWGVIVASIIVCIGAVIFLTREGNLKPQYATFNGEPEQFRNVWQILASTLVPSGRGIIETGVLLLITIPLLRVLLSVISFGKEKDKVYVIITSVVLCFLLFSLFYQR